MKYKILSAFVSIIVAFLVVASFKPSKFRYEKSVIIDAPIAKVFPFISTFKMGNKWSPYVRKDPNMKIEISENDGQVGSFMTFAGNTEVGAGRLDMLAVEQGRKISIKLTMTEPFKSEAIIDYELQAEGDKTKFIWVMSGDGGFFGKIISIFIDCEKMVTADFDIGMNNLRQLLSN